MSLEQHPIDEHVISGVHHESQPEDLPVEVIHDLAEICEAIQTCLESLGLSMRHKEDGEEIPTPLLPEEREAVRTLLFHLESLLIEQAGPVHTRLKVRAATQPQNAQLEWVLEEIDHAMQMVKAHDPSRQETKAQRKAQRRRDKLAKQTIDASRADTYFVSYYI
jgi:hypothetical protein